MLENDIFKEYTEIGFQIMDLQNRQDILKKQIERTMLDSGTEKVKTPFGTFFFRNSKKYEYQPSFEEKMKDLKKEQKTDRDILLEDGINDGEVEVYEEKTLSYRKS